MSNTKISRCYYKNKVFRNTYDLIHNVLKNNELRQGCLGDLMNTHGGIYVIFN
jgi:hypothetical protein